MTEINRALVFLGELPWHAPLFLTPKGDAAVHLTTGDDDTIVTVKWLASIHRGAGRAALTIITETADHHGITLQLTARPQSPMGAGLYMTPAKLEVFYAGFGFVLTGRRSSEGFAHMVRQPGAGLRTPRP